MGHLQRLGSVQCTVCRDRADPFDVVDFGRSCEDRRRPGAPLTGKPIYYFRCRSCHFCFTPEMAGWPKQRFLDEVYNDEYVEADPDYPQLRPLGNARLLAGLFPCFAGRRHLDYGGGNGLLSRTLRSARWNSSSYDPFVDDTTDPSAIGSFDLISAFEVFEHVPDIHEVLESVTFLMRDEAILLFSTLLCDGNIVSGERLSWWYAAPRNGHVSLYSTASLARLAELYGFGFGSFNAGLHLFFRPGAVNWANELVSAATPP